MFEQFFDSPSRIQSLRNVPGGWLLEEFAKELYHSGYAKITARNHIREAEHFLYWIDQTNSQISCLNEKSIELFDRHLDQCQCPRYGHDYRLRLLNGVHLFLKHLRDAGLITAYDIESKAQDPALLTDFCLWMRQQRGTSDLTLHNYSLSIRALLKHLGEDPVNFDAKSLRQFILKKSQNSGWGGSEKLCDGASHVSSLPNS
jgi:hypothetical protein